MNPWGLIIGIWIGIAINDIGLGLIIGICLGLALGDDSSKRRP